MSATEATFAPVKKKIEDAGIDLRILCYNMNVRTTKDDEIEYAFMMAKALGVKAISTSTQVSMAKRTAPFADKHKIPLAFHGHDNLTDPDEIATPESFATILAASKYHAINLDIGHFTAANFDPVAYIQEHHDRITHLHLKDRKKDHGANVPWGQGDTPIKPVLKLLREEQVGHARQHRVRISRATRWSKSRSAWLTARKRSRLGQAGLGIRDRGSRFVPPKGEATTSDP